MTTRRGFIQGVLVAIGAAVMPKVAEAEVETVTVPHRKAPLLDNLTGPTIDMDALNASARNAAGAITEQAEAFDFVTERFTRYSDVFSQELTDSGAFTREDLLAFLERDRQRGLDFIHGTGSGPVLGCIGWEPQFVIATQAADCKLTIHGNDWTWPDEDNQPI